MIQWIRGQLDASYVGEPSKLALPRFDSSAQTNPRRYQLRVFRAAVREVKAIAPPADARPPVVEPPEEDTPCAGEPFAHEPSFRQLRIDDAHVAQLRGPGSSFQGALFDVRVSAVELSFPAEKDGRAYGRMTGTVVACVVVPPEPPPERVPASELVREPLPELPPGKLFVASEERSEESTEPASEEPEPAAPEGDPPSLLPSLLLCAAVCLVLALMRGALPAVLWAVFMLPTLVARRFLSGVLPDARGLHMVSAVLVSIQLACTAAVLKTFWSRGCHELTFLPLLGVVATLFPSGVLPSPLALLCNAVCLAAILLGWCA